MEVLSKSHFQTSQYESFNFKSDEITN